MNRPEAAALVVAILLVAPGCSGGTKAGGRGATHAIVLTMASQIAGGQPNQLARFASEVARRSGGTVRIDFKADWRAGDPHQELDTIRDVKAGRVDLGWVGARAWDWVGVSNFDPLVAPLLIDSYPLERAVFARGIPQRMLQGVGRAGVVGIGVLPGPMRKLLGVRHAFRFAADFRGETIGAQGLVAGEMFLALGARPRQMFAQEMLGTLDAVESQMSAILGNGYDKSARYLSANLNLWPRPLVIFASRKVFGSLSAKQRDALRAGAAAAVSEALAASQKEDAGAVRALCARGMLAFVDLTSAQLGNLRRAVAPVYRRLERHAAARQAIREIEALKPAFAPVPAIHCGPASTSRATTATPIDGSWRMTVSVDQLRRSPVYRVYGNDNPTQQDFNADAGAYTFVFHDGRLRSSIEGQVSNGRDTGTYRIDGDRVIFHITGGHDVGETWVYRWSVYRDTLTFTKPQTGAQGPPNPTFAPWHRVGR
jgi:TRAP-type C4-dicarboxylate transport system substrate-binding protein